MKINESDAATPLLQPLGDADAAACADGVCVVPQQQEEASSDAD